MSEGESLDSNVLHAMVEASRLKRYSPDNTLMRNSQDLAELMLKDKSKQDSTHILAHQIESLREMERQNEDMTQ